MSARGPFFAAMLPASLTSRVFALYSITLLLFVGAGLALFLKYQYRQQVEDTQQASVMLVEVVAQALQDSVVIGDYDTVRRTLDKAVLGPIFASAMFLDTGGGIVRAQDHEEVTTQTPAWLVRFIEGELYDVNRNISVGGKDYGVLRLQFDAPHVAAELWYMSLVALSLGLVSLVGGLVLIRFALASWLGSLDQLRTLVEELGRGTLEAGRQVPQDAPSEIRQVVELFNQTAVLVREREASRHALEAAKNTAEQASLAKGQFLATMSHELRTPMNAILGILQLLQSTELDEQQRSYASKTEGAARSLLGLLNEILDFSKIEAGKMTLDPRPFRLDRLLRDLSVILSAYVGGKGIDVLFDVDPTVPRALVGDDMRLSQILINLGGNAIKFTEHGEVVVGVRLLECTPHDVVLEFAVRDSGIGIAPENQSHIFNGFSQAEASTTRRFGGTGLGLAISQRLVSLMDGELKVRSALGQGSTFSFSARLQLDQPDVTAALPDHPASSLRTLVIDDNEVARTLLTGMTTRLGWPTDMAGGGALAVRMVNQALTASRPYQVVFVDWEMPEMDGWDASNRIRALVGDRCLIIMVSACGTEMLARRSVDERATIDGFLVKPVTASMLHDAVVDAQAARAKARVGGNPAPVKAAIDKPKRLLGMRLLVVEDNKINQLVAKGLLGQEGAAVTLADNGQLGVDALRGDAGMFDAVLMDVQMPVMDGYVAARTVRTELGLTTLPIIAMTANAMASDREACLAAGMNDHVGKPFEIDHLVATLRRFVPLDAAPLV